MSHVYLGIDSATRYLSLALWNDERGLLAEYREDLGREHAARIVPELARLFDRARLPPGGVSAIGVGVGPGSYTGVRVGVATAKGLARAWGVPLGGASTLAAIALTALLPGETGVAALDARRGNVYAAIYRRPEDPTDLRFEVLEAPAKVPRSWLQARGAELRVVEDAAPDASLTAAMAREGDPAEASYL